MKISLIIAWICVLIVGSGRWSHAEFNSAVCFIGCFTENKNCIAGITAVNAIEISDQQEACASNKVECDNKCHAAVKEDMDQKEKLLQQQREQQPPLEQEAQPAKEED